MNTLLPIDVVLPSLCDVLAQRHEVLLEAPPGAGKTTRVPLALLSQPWLAGQKIVLLEPRRLAARAAAERLAVALGESVGETVGYRMRLERKVGPNTRIEVVTEGILTRQLQDDPGLEGVGLVIFDEVHERSLNTDMALALTLNGREWLRDGPPLKVLLMSATLEGERLAALLNDAPIIRSEGRQFPVSIQWGRAAAPGEALEPRVIQTLLHAVAEQPGSVLVFLPGQAEIRRVQRALEETLTHPSVRICPLYGELTLDAQRAAIEPAPPGIRKIVLATNIAETSLTIDGVRVVIDAGLERAPRFDPASGMTRLDTQRIARASATQRAGRAGRLEPGVCYRLWSETQHEQLPAHTTAEILHADLADAALQLARWGVTDPNELLWLDVPPSAALAQARDLLARLGAVVQRGTQWALTPHGQAMATFPAHPRLAHLLLSGHALGLGDVACQLAALLSERDTLRGQGADLQLRLTALNSPTRGSVPNRVQKLAQQFRNQLPKIAKKSPQNADDSDWLGCLLAFAYPDRIAQQRRAGSAEYRLANGRAACFTEPDALMKHEWLVVADLGSRQGQREERIYLATALNPARFDDALAEQVRLVEHLEWDEREGLLRAEQQRRLGELVISREPLPNLSETARAHALLALVRRKGLTLFTWTPALRQWQARVALLRRLDLAEHGHSEWPDISDEALLATLEQWLLPYLSKVSRLSHFAALDMASLLSGLLPWPLPQRLEEWAPQTLSVPSGSRIRLDYSEEHPVLAVRLQELFGLASTPRLAGGRIAVKLHLLSPAHRPVQVTQDLASFWANTYTDVKKDLKGRYPKHYWPDNPLIAEPTARVKRK